VTFRTLKDLLPLALPISLTQLAILGMQLVDTLFIGRLEGPLSAQAIGGVGIGNATYAVILLLGIGLLFGMDSIVSHSYGAGKMKDVHESLIQGLYLSTLVSWPFMLLMWLLAQQMDHFGIDLGAARQATIFLETVTWSLWPTLLFMAMRQYLQAMDVAKPLLYILPVGYFLAFHRNWGVFGLWIGLSLGLVVVASTLLLVWRSLAPRATASAC
jgi:multidrug resistance protein, MATE family